MTKLLLNTSSLVINIQGNFDFPNNKYCKTSNIKKLIKVMESGSAQLQYLGNDFSKQSCDPEITEDSLIIAMHIIDDPITIDYTESVQEQIGRFLRQIKKNTSRILLQEEFKNGQKLQQFFEIYVRAVPDYSRGCRNLKQA